jgi:hypothetical protein
VADESTEQVDQEIPAEPPKRGGRGMLRVVKAVAFVSVIVVVQVVVAAMLAPSAADTVKFAQQLVAASHGDADSAEGAHGGDDKTHGGHGAYGHGELPTAWS